LEPTGTRCCLRSGGSVWRRFNLQPAVALLGKGSLKCRQQCFDTSMKYTVEISKSHVVPHVFLVNLVNYVSQAFCHSSEEFLYDFGCYFKKC
jgi:hypothetical protein